VPHSIPVLCYHNVSQADGHTPERFEEHLAAIRAAGYRSITARELLRALRGDTPVPDKACVLTFDDCHLSNWTLAAPLLAKYGMTGVFFCVTDFISEGAKRPQLAPERGGPELLSAPESFRRALKSGDCSQFMNEAELRARVALIQDRTFGMRNLAMDALLGLIRDLERARATDPTSAAVREAQDYQRQGQFLLDFVEAENSVGFHAPQEAARLLQKSIDFTRRGQLALRPLAAGTR